MSKLKELLKQHDLTTIAYLNRGNRPQRGWNQAPDPVWRAACDTFVKFYGDKVHCETSYESAYIKCGKRCDSHYMYLHYEDNATNAVYGYSWPGQNYLVSKNLLTIDVLHEAIKTKEAELAAARKKRFEKIQSPRDAIRVTFRDLGIKASMVGGNPRIDCGPCDVEFRASKEDSDPKVGVFFVYRAHYAQEIAITTLSIADPRFNKQIEAIAFNANNLNKLMLGEVQPKSVQEVK